jgi:DNA-binding transcriptional ArsR family regulator
MSDDNRREILLLLEKKDMILTEVAEHFNSILSALSRQPKDADLITEKKETKNRFYSLNRKKTLELVEFLRVCINTI